MNKKIRLNVFFPESIINLIQIDEESLKYITSLRMNKYIVENIQRHLEKHKLDSEKCNIADITCGVGGDTLSFSRKFNNVMSIEINELRYKYLCNNVSVSNTKNVDLVMGCCVENIKSYQSYDIIYMDPPWGGDDYKMKERLKIKLISIDNKETELEDFINLLLDQTMAKIICLKLPINYDLTHFIKKINKDKINHICLHRLNKIHQIIIETKLILTDIK